MDNLRRFYRGFSCPGEKLDEAFLEFITVEYARETVRRFLAKHKVEFSVSAADLASFLENWLNKETTYETVWDLAFGECAKSMFGGNHTDPVGLGTSIGLRISSCGCTVDWHVNQQSGARFIWGRGLLPPCERIRVSGNSCRVVTRAQSPAKGREIVFRRQGKGSHTSKLDRFPSVSTDRGHISFLVRPALVSPEFEEDRPKVSSISHPDLVASLGAALELLRNQAPAYLGWVQRVVRYIIPTQSSHVKIIESGSSNRRPGVLNISFPAKPAACAEMLVHEASHQYLYLLERLGPVEDGSDPNLYFSPIKQCGRPIRAILLAFHAFANVLLFYRMCRESDLSDGGYWATQEAQLRPQVDELAKALSMTRALTARGEALWQPVAERIRAKG